MLSSVVSVQGSDTTEGESSIEADPKKRKRKRNRGTPKGSSKPRAFAVVGVFTNNYYLLTKVRFFFTHIAVGEDANGHTAINE
jgi:hypothetical protein